MLSLSDFTMLEPDSMAAAFELSLIGPSSLLSSLSLSSMSISPCLSLESPTYFEHVPLRLWNDFEFFIIFWTGDAWSAGQAERPLLFDEELFLAGEARSM